MSFRRSDCIRQRSSGKSNELSEEGFGEWRRAGGRKGRRGREAEQKRDEFEGDGEVVVCFVFVCSEEGRDELEEG